MTLKLVTGALGSPAERQRLDHALPVSPPVSSARGLRVLKLQLQREVAPAIMWRGENAEGEPVAIFELDADALPASRRRFLQDAAALARVTREAPNPGLLQVHALAPDGNSFVAELWQGGDLRDLVERGLTLGKKLGLVRRICAALTAAHAQCLYFGRLRPESILL